METPYGSYAAIIKAIILADNKITEDERERFNDFFADYYDLPPGKREELWLATFNDETPIEEHIVAVKDDLKDQPMAMVQFFKFLNSCIYRDELSDVEYETFEHIEELLLT
jgi:uncharacterized tellurite resistance protein B-like protein